jgi:hypothetical protein
MDAWALRVLPEEVGADYLLFGAAEAAAVPVVERERKHISLLERLYLPLKK